MMYIYGADLCVLPKTSLYFCVYIVYHSLGLLFRSTIRVVIGLVFKLIRRHSGPSVNALHFSFLLPYTAIPVGTQLTIK